ncbi:MAG: hypothetical protein FJ291_03400 [Planctomycetes bacterium]|nr:hypothetical protein [Planctomycetota bacterium]
MFASLAAPQVTSAATERPVRVCLPPAPHTTDWQKAWTPNERLQVCVSLYFRERLAALRGVEVMAEDWAGSVLFFSGQEMTGTKAMPTLAELRAHAPVDVAVLFGDRDGPVRCTILSGKGAEVVPAPAKADTLARLQAVAERLGPALGLDAAATAVLGDGWHLPSPVLEACLVSQRIAGAWVTNSGESQLLCLRRFIQDVGKHPMLAAAVLRAGIVLSADSRKPERPAQDVEMLRLSLVAALGTPAEGDAVAFLRRTAHGRDALEKELATLAAALTVDAAEAVLDGKGAPEADPHSLARGLGAVRCLAAVNSARLAPLLPRLAGNENAAVRAAAGYALAAPESGPVTLAAGLAADRGPAVAFAGHYALWRRGEKAEAGLPIARSLFGAPATRTSLVEEFLAGAGTHEDEPRLRKLLEGTTAERRLAFSGLARLGALRAEDCRGCLQSADDGVLAIGLKAMDAKTAAACRDALVALANGPHGPAAESARRALRPLRPTDLPAQLAFDLEVEHLYLRLRAIEQMAKQPEPWAALLLERATANPDPQVRAGALMALHAKAPEAALKVLPRLLRDPMVWVRVHASSLAAKLRAPALGDAVAAALAAETDASCRIYLEAAQGKPMPKAVNAFDLGRTRLGLCGYGRGAAESPLGWYYCLYPKVDDVGRKAHESGKTLIGRTNTTAGNPVQVLFHPVWRDLWWTNLRKELTDLAHLDGLVVGEETMYAPAWSLWADGWRCFCIEAGIDAEKVAGDRTKLSQPEARAFLDWEQERVVDGFNRMYDFIKLDQGAQRPGFLVGTYVPSQNGPNVAEHRWKFDVGGAYWYQADNRVRYNMIRRFRTVWPGRPLMYLVSGNAGLPLLAHVNYKLQVPDGLVLNRACNAYADAACAWAAGAEPGFFVAWLFSGKDVKPGPNASGVWVWLEDMARDSKPLADGLENVWRGVAGQYRLDAEIRKTKGPNAVPEDIAKQGDAKGIALDEADPAKDPFAQRAAADRERSRLGFFLEQKALYDVARAFAGLPRPREDFAALMVGGATALPQFAALDGYDAVELLNLLPHCKLAKYRLIGIEVSAEAPVRDATIAAVRAWLKEQPGLLYVRGFLSTDNANEASTASDHDGRLLEDWPWEADITFVKDHYVVRGSGAKPLAGDAAACTRASWRDAGFKGAVLFDCGKTSAEEFQSLLIALHKDLGVGIRADGVPGMIRAKGDGVTACISNGSAAAEATVLGVDLFSGEANPVVGRGRSAAITVDNYRGAYAASYNGVSILCDAPIEEVKPVAGGLEVRCAGLIRAAAARGDVTVRPQPPAVEGQTETILKWVLFGDTGGVARLPGAGSRLIFVRGTGILTFTAVPSK